MDLNMRFLDEEYGEDGLLKKLSFKYPDNYNFGYDVVDEIAANEPDRRAMVWCNPKGDERTFTFGDISRLSNKAANYLRSLGRATWS